MTDVAVDTDTDTDTNTAADTEFQQYMAARWPALVRTAYLLTGDAHLAEDVAQTALTKVYASWRRVRKADDVDAYVRRVLVNANAGRFRKRRVAEHLTGTFPDAMRAGDDADGGSAAVVEQRSLLMAALAELTPRQRAVVVLRYWEDLSEKEVASVLGCSVGTVKSQSSKALARLRTGAVLAGELGGPGRLGEPAGARAGAPAGASPAAPPWHGSASSNPTEGVGK